MKDFISYIRKFSTREFIIFFSEMSIELYKAQQDETEGKLMCNITFPLDILKYGFMHKQVQIMLSAWDIPELVYVSIANANDYRKEVMTREKAGTVVNLYRGYEEEYTKKEYSNGETLPAIWKLMTGMTYEQFKYQNLAWTYQNFNRNYHILIGSKKICRDIIIDINQITQEIFELDADGFLTEIMYLLFLCCVSSTPLKAADDLYSCRKSNVSKEHLKKVIDYYSVTYGDVRKSSIQKQIFYSKPFVVTEKKEEPVMVSIYLVQMLLADGLYWLIRDYYLENDLGNGFINGFGTMFESYFEELAEFYLTEDMWNKIPKQESKSADYFVEFENVVFLFELKSGLLGIMGKQQVPDIQPIDTFYRRNILEAYEQLTQSEKEYQGKKLLSKFFYYMKL